MIVGIGGLLLMTGLLGGLLAPSRRNRQPPAHAQETGSVATAAGGVEGNVFGSGFVNDQDSQAEGDEVKADETEDEGEAKGGEEGVTEGEDETEGGDIEGEEIVEPSDNETAGENFEYEHVIARVDSQQCSPTDDSLPLLVAVSNRELLIGCHSFAEYLSPKFETIFVLNEEVVKVWGVDKLVENVTCEQTLGAHVFLLDNYGGEWLGRRVAVDYILNEMNDRNVEFLNQMNCDTHPIPKGHANYLTLEQIMEKMISDFRVARAQREPDRYPEIEIPDFPLVVDQEESSRWLKYGILAMVPLLFEDFNDMDALPLNPHGVDVCNWEEKGGLSGRPDKFGDFPWLCDVHRFTENHWLMFDAEKLTAPAVKAQFLDATGKAGINTYASDTRLTPRMAAEHNLVTVLNLDVHGQQNFCHGEDSMDDYPVDLDWVRVMSWSHMAEQRGPSAAYDTWNGFDSQVIESPYMGGTLTNFAHRHAGKSESPWIPVGLNGLSLESCDLCTKFVDALLKSFGYTYSEEDDDYLYYSLKGIYPMNLYVHVLHSNDKAADDTWEFLQVEEMTTGKKYRYIADGAYPTKKMRTLHPEERLIPVPKNGQILKLQGPSDINTRVYIHTRGKQTMISVARPIKTKRTLVDTLRRQNLISIRLPKI